MSRLMNPGWLAMGVPSAFRKNSSGHAPRPQDHPQLFRRERAAAKLVAARRRVAVEASVRERAVQVQADLSVGVDRLLHPLAVGAPRRTDLQENGSALCLGPLDHLPERAGRHLHLGVGRSHAEGEDKSRRKNKGKEH